MRRHLVFEMPAYGLGQNPPLDLSSYSNHIVYTISVGNARDILIEDGPGVKFFCCDVTSRRADNFHPSLVGLLLGLASITAGKNER
jgi:hypothetical protein